MPLCIICEGTHLAKVCAKICPFLVLKLNGTHLTRSEAIPSASRCTFFDAKAVLGIRQYIQGTGVNK